MQDQAFKWACIAQIRDSSWALSGEEVDNSSLSYWNSKRPLSPSLILYPF